MTLIRCRVVDARLSVLIHGASAQLFERERVKGGKEGNFVVVRRPAGLTARRGGL
jgi:hypothetical protein